MNRRGGVARSWLSRPAIMLAIGAVAIGPGPGAQAARVVAAAGTGDLMPARSDPMRVRPPHADRESLALIPSPPVEMAASTTTVVRSTGAPSTRPPGWGRSGRFAYGYCTWWVALRRPIPWTGNAWQWWGNARQAGFAEGSIPRPGAIMVMGISWSSPQGHVAYVESVAADGSYTVSEMNWWGVAGGGWGRVDYRRVTSMRSVIGFIY